MRFKITGWKQVVIYSLLATALAVAVPVITVMVVLWPLPRGILLPIVAIAAVIPLFIALPLSVAFNYMLMLLNRTIAAVDAHVKYDNLTGLLTRGEFMRQTEALRVRGGFLLLLDADHFKAINDTYGHPAGDEVLRTAATLINQTIGPTGLCGRIGGEEFAVFMPAVSRRQALLAAQGCCAAMRNQPILHADQSIRLTFSVGVAEDRSHRPFSETLNVADHHLYRAKRAGRDQVAAEETLDQETLAIAS